MKTASTRLRELSAQLVAAFASGHWPDLLGKSKQEVRAFLPERLLEGCAGLSTRDYRLALRSAMAPKIRVIKRRQKKASGASRARPLAPR